MVLKVSIGLVDSNHVAVHESLFASQIDFL